MTASRCRRPSARFRPHVETLETRITPRVFTVRSLLDTPDETPGDGVAADSNGNATLRAAIQEANAFPGADEIRFALPGPNPVIRPAAPLPAISQQLKIDGYSQAGSRANTLANGSDAVLVVQIDGAGAGAAADGLTVHAGDCEIRGLVLTGFGRMGIVVEGAIVPRTVIAGNFIGVARDGSTRAANGNDGIRVQGGATDTLIGGADPASRNVISGNGNDGIDIQGVGTNRTRVLGNIVGLTALGTFPLGNLSNGVAVNAGARETFVGGGTSMGGNVISGNSVSGVAVLSGAAFTTILGNVIGTDPIGTGTRPPQPNAPSYGNGAHGIFFDTANDATIGGSPTLGEGNVVSNNAGNGISIRNSARVRIVGNFVGTDRAGQLDLGNGVFGVQLNTNASANIVERNQISGNDGSGVGIQSGATNNIVRTNLIGTNAAGTAALPNAQFGVRIANASRNTIGGPTAADGNTIAFNGVALNRRGHGIEVVSGTGNALRRNLIFDNAGRGIDLNNDSFTLNDPAPAFGQDGDQDNGPNLANQLQNYPVVTRVRPNGANRDMTWTLRSAPDRDYIIEFYTNDTADPSGFGEARTFLEERTVRTRAGDGVARITLTLTPTQRFVAATATDPNGNTSELSMIDTDADGLADAWETGGIDINEDGTNDLTLASAINHKDLFVEVDAMVDRVPNAGALTDVVRAFNEAPNDLVQNPDGANGITLHATLDETNIVRAAFPGMFVQFDAIKAARFGTAIERGDANAANILAAKRLVYRYCVFGDTHSGGRSSGFSELWGNDFTVTLGTFVPAGGSREEQAATFMHELGHTLGLDHGGAGDDGTDATIDRTNYKPNYHSIMNYTWQFRDATYGPWSLDYSRDAFPNLNENNLDEAAGIGGHDRHTVRLGSDDNPQEVVAERGPVDWNQDGDTADAGVVRNLNDDRDIHGNPILGVLVGREDWSMLRYYFLESPNFTDNRHVVPPGAGEEAEPTPPAPPSVVGRVFATWPGFDLDAPRPQREPARPQPPHVARTPSALPAPSATPRRADAERSSVRVPTRRPLALRASTKFILAGASDWILPARTEF